MLISFFLFETFKEDVLEEVLPVASYATTVRRKVVDFAAKIINDESRDHPQGDPSRYGQFAL